MGYLFIKHTDGIYEINRKVRVEETEEKEIIKILKHFNLNPEMIEVESYDTTTFSTGGYTFYLNEQYLFGEIMKKIQSVLLKDSGRAKKFARLSKE